ncbi:hypothetical protein CDV55_104254 [Aspergillus turcosus]|nr:hypothetical protein CDV55_104254 [Aspergillus turcosus]
MESKASSEQELTPAEFQVYNSLAERMEYYHSAFRAHWRQIYQSCASGQKLSKGSQKAIITSGLSFCVQLQLHHHYEEKFIYPMLATRLPQFRPERHLTDQHDEIEQGIEIIQTYLTDCERRSEWFDVDALRTMMEGVQETLLAHLDDEVEALGAENMRRGWTPKSQIALSRGSCLSAGLGLGLTAEEAAALADQSRVDTITKPSLRSDFPLLTSSESSMAPKTVVIIGGSFAGLKVARGLLDEIPGDTIRVVMINPSEKFYYCIAAPRILAKPKAFRPDEYLIPIAPAFSHYGQRFQLFVGLATRIEEAGRTVTVAPTQGEPVTVPFDYLVLASGSSTKSTQQGFLHAGSHCGSIIVGGAGPIGIEFVGELLEAWSDKPKRSITLVSSTEQLLPVLKASAGNAAERFLVDRGVKLIKGHKVMDAVNNGSSWTVNLSNGQSLTADLYVSTAGVLPNSSYIPRDFLDAEGWVRIDDKFHVRSATSTKSHIYAVGDITSLPTRTLVKINEQVPILVKNLKADLEGSSTARPAYDVKAASDGKRILMFVPLGSRTGTGQMMGFVPWGWMVAKIKGKDFFVSKAASMAGLA